MKNGILKLVGLWAVFALMPNVSRANHEFIVGKTMDSILVVGIQDDQNPKKAKDGKRKTEAEKDNSKTTRAEPKGTDVKKPDIKEVPKAKPRLRPAAVTDKIKIKRIPGKVKGLIKSINF